MTTLSALVDDVYGMLFGASQSERPDEDTIDGALAQAATSVTMATESMWTRGDYAEFATDGEIIIFAADADGATTIRRGQRGTTDATQTDGSVVYRNPTFARYEIERLIDQVVRNDLWPNVWTWEAESLSFVSPDTTYDLGAYIEDVVTVYQYNLNSDSRFYPLEQTMWDVERQINAAAGAASGNLFRLLRVQDESETVYYTAKRRPDPDDLANMSDEVAELIPWAVAGKLAAASRVIPKRRRPTADDTQEGEGGEFRDYRGFMSEFLRMRKQLNTKLTREVPTAPKFRARRRRKAF